MASFDEVMEEQLNAFALIRRIIPNFNKLAKARRTSTAVQTRLTCLQNYWDSCQQRHAKLCTAAGEDVRSTHSYFTQDKFTLISDSVEEIRDILSEILDSFRLNTSRANDNVTFSHEPVKPIVHLPKINIPTFSGEITKWETFRDTFESLVANRTELSNIQKLHYLKSSLTGEAILILSNIQITDANYQSAWELLKKRFDNPRAIVNAHLKAFMDIPCASSQSVNSLRNLRDKTCDIYTALLNLKRPVNHWEDLLIFVTVSKLDKVTRRDWELSLGDNVDIPNFAELDGFLTARIRALEAIQSHTDSVSKSETCKANKFGVVRAHQASVGDGRCVACGGTHSIHKCKVFLCQTVAQRIEVLKRGKCCFNCLRQGHLPWSCKSSNACTICRQKHHSLIHREKNEIRTGLISTSEPDPLPGSSRPSTTEDENRMGKGIISSNSASSKAVAATLLPTAYVLLRGRSGLAIRVRALIDQGSQVSFVSESITQLLRADRRSVSVDVAGIGGVPAGKAKHVASFSIEPCSQDGPVLPLSALVVSRLTAYIPRPFPVDGNRAFWKSLRLADSLSDAEHRIELIIGADYCGSILREGLIRGPDGGLTAQLTIFGWVVFGPSRRSHSNEDGTRVFVNHVTGCDSLNDSLRHFWELEEVPSRPSLTEEEARCESHFVKTHTRQPDGRYVVGLPFKSPPPILIGETERDARRIFLSNEARLNRQPHVNNAYKVFMAEYESLGHMERVPTSDVGGKQTVYIPHHAVVKESDSGPKVRVVFNASRMSSNQTSLNDFLMIGPKLQSDLFALILRWRSHQFVIITDIEKMFRQIRVRTADADYQRIFWRPDSNAEPVVFRLLTVTYGMASAPYLANRVIKQLVSDEGARFSLAAAELENGVYVDDIMIGAEDIVSLKQIKQQLTELLMAGGFTTHKWASNEPCLLRDLPDAGHCLMIEKCLGEDSGIKVLGISWSPSADAFHMQIRLNPVSVFTKRTFLSLLSRIFDPLGWVSPVTINAKIIMQILWLRKVDWDEPLVGELSQRCLTYQVQLSALDKIVIPRWTGQRGKTLGVEIHGFSDASNVAYAAVVYLRVGSERSAKVSLLYAKTRVAPLKVQSIPRLELCAALLMVRAIEFVQASMHLADAQVYCWTDSTVVLAWIRRVPSRWATFVANRVSSIITTLPRANWQYVPSADNPADCASRGVSALDLYTHPLWWCGPCWLQHSDSEWPVCSFKLETEIEMRRDTHTHTALCQNEWNLPDEVSSWVKLLRITAYVMRFAFNTRNPQTRVAQRYLTVAEINRAKWFWVRVVQASHFREELRELRNKGVIKSTNKSMTALDARLDADGVLRVGGRLRRAELSEDKKFPVLLPKCRVSELIVRHMHICSLHGGLQSTLRMVRQTFWIFDARNRVRSCIRNCVTCVRQRATPLWQRMGDLPKERVRPARPFSITGVDYAGPFFIRNMKGRGHKTHKAYLILFVCLSTRAIHLEVASDYSTNGFLAAFNRFTARRGLPAVVYSDNGTNFHGADRELSRCLRDVLKEVDLQNHFSTDGIEWRFIPPAAPHFGGLWEAGVKSVKFHLRRIMGDFKPTFEEFSTLLCNIECILNSRPISPLYDDPETFDALTPGHFLVGSHLKSVPNVSVCERDIGRLSRWQSVQLIRERFWRIWSADYLNALQQRGKWRTAQDNLKIGDLVVLRNSNLPPTKWDLGRVIQCHPGEDNLVRVVTVRTARSVLKRPITQLCKLPIPPTDIPLQG